MKHDLMTADLRVLLIAPHLSREAVGEAFVAFKWAEALSERVRLTVACFESPGHTPVAEQLPGVDIATWPYPRWLRRFPRFDSMLKPSWPIFCRHVRGFLRGEAGRFDIAHQIMPQAMRYATPLRGFGVPYVVGPLGGALETPAAFAAEAAAAPWFTRLRRLDALRLRHDPWLRAGYAEAALVLGVAPYVREVLRDVPLRRYEDVLELGIDDLAPERPARGDGGLRLLHVGRGVRTKGLRDVVRALAHLADRPDITLVSAGDGEEIALCKAEASRLGVASRVAFLGRVPRARVEELYAGADVFAFPSFREPAGGVLYEAMRWGLPVIAARRGGPDWIVDDNCGLKVDVTDPHRMAGDVAQAIRRLADDPALRARLGVGARDKVEREGVWGVKADQLVRLYREVLA